MRIAAPKMAREASPVIKAVRIRMEIPLSGKTEREGFEPSEAVNPASFPRMCPKPLGDLSKL